MDQIPPFLNGQNYFHHTDEVRPPAMVSNQRYSIWFPPNAARSNGSHIVVTYNGRDVFLFVYCGVCNQWRMPLEGGHTGSHHRQFVNGEICLPIGHTSWTIYFMINVHYQLDFQVAHVRWNPNLALPGIIEIPQVVAPPLAIQAPPLAIQALPLEEESDDEDEFPPPAAAGRNGYRAAANLIFGQDESSEEDAPPPRPNRMIRRGIDENNVVRRANRRPARANAGVIDTYVPSPPRVSKRRRREVFGNVTNRDPAQDEDE